MADCTSEKTSPPTPTLIYFHHQHQHQHQQHRRIPTKHYYYSSDSYSSLIPTTTTTTTTTTTDTFREGASLFRLSFPIALTALLFYSRSVVSMLFLGSLGDLSLAAGSLALAFANITGYSVLSGLSLGMEPLCSQAFGAKQHRLLSVTLYRSVLFLLCSSLPISLLWINMSAILLHLGQDPDITSLSQTYLLYSLPDLLSFSFIHPIRIYLRSQGITTPLTLTAALAALLHLPLNFLFVNHFGLGTAGVAAAGALSNLSLFLFLTLYYLFSDDHHHDEKMIEEEEETTIKEEETMGGPSSSSSSSLRSDCLSGWGPLARLALPSCVSVCLEWWWYELMILLCGLLPDPKPAIASMGVLIQTTALIYVFPSSLGFGVSTRVGNELGANRPARARTSATVSLLSAALMGFVAMGSATLMKDAWGRMFTADPEILRLTAAALPILGLCELGNCPQTVGCGVLRGSARPAHAAHVNLGAFYLVGMPVGVGLAFGLGLGFCGLWLGLLSAQVCCAGLMLYVVGTTDWEAQAMRAQILTRSSSSSSSTPAAAAVAAAAAAGGGGGGGGLGIGIGKQHLLTTSSSSSSGRRPRRQEEVVEEDIEKVVVMVEEKRDYTYYEPLISIKVTEVDK